MFHSKNGERLFFEGESRCFAHVHHTCKHNLSSFQRWRCGNLAKKRKREIAHALVTTRKSIKLDKKLYFPFRYHCDICGYETAFEIRIRCHMRVSHDTKDRFTDQYAVRLRHSQLMQNELSYTNRNPLQLLYDGFLELEKRKRVKAGRKITEEESD